MTDLSQGLGPDPLLGQVLEGRYRIAERIGSGGMSAVYRADPVDGSPPVAVKVLHDELLRDEAQKERFEREARALFGLDHPNILQVSDFGVVNGVPFLVMEQLHGMTLDKFTEDELPAPEIALHIVEQVLEGLAYAHQQGVLHRDLKTENVFVAQAPNGGLTAKLLDFGLVKFVDDDRWGQGKQLTSYGEVFGTPAYMSPEQCTGAHVDTGSDVYSMGVLTFELFTGTWPFVEETRVDMLRAHLMTPVPSLASANSEVTFRPEFDAFVQRALQKDAKDRFENAGAMLTALRAIAKPVARRHVRQDSAANFKVIPSGPAALGSLATDSTARHAAQPPARVSSGVPPILVWSFVVLFVLLLGAAAALFAVVLLT
ncbi:MAG: serine/threonine-protein kinase [Myxococcota bacterium]